ncbi:MAG: phospho-sugar mutase [Firmicutes bacterium]|nr:phospho-sugar mutase [Bacillota bacterium]
MKDYMKKYDFWLKDDAFDEATKAELRAIAGNETEIEERFYKDLEFGTGGLRGIMGAGTNRMNRYTVGKATQGLANYILKQKETHGKEGVAISFDSRHNSPEFAKLSALVLNANGIKTYMFKTLHPTPMLSYAVREFNCIAGIMLTASHNPREYNGYKAYWDDGCQVSFPRDEEIIAEVDAITDYADIKTMDETEAASKGLFNLIPEEFDDKYLATVMQQSLNSDVVKALPDFKIVYTPLNGTGNIPVNRILEMAGFKNVLTVPEQQLPNGDFPTTPYPNPEDPKAFALAIELAKKVDADIIVGTDPDADRMGALYKDESGEYVVISGNLSGALLAEYVLGERHAKGLLPENPAMIKTIVTSKMTDEIAKRYNVACFDVLTGFKHIAGLIRSFEADNSYKFVYGFEESFGYLAGDYARDKDAVCSTLLICELAALYKSRGMSLADGISELYSKYGFFSDKVKSITLTGMEGVAQIKSIMRELRNEPPKALGGEEITIIRDYDTGVFTELATGATQKSTLPKSDVLHYTLADGSWICIRPSGTEPKIKFYTGVKKSTMAEADAKCKAIEDAMSALVDDILNK